MGTPVEMGHLVLLLLSLTWQIRQAQSQDTVALIVGGQSLDGVNPGEDSVPVASVELFGCPYRSQSSYLVEDYPFRNFWSAGRFYDGYGLSCGGFACEVASCDGSTDACFSYGSDGLWTPHSNLSENLFNFIIVEAVDLDADPPSEELTLLTIGPSTRTQIYDKDENSWRQYRQIPEGNDIVWSASRCAVQVGDSVYHIDERIYRLDTMDWEIEDLGPVPVDLSQPERCTAMEIYGRPGVLLKSGFWYDIERYSWEERAFPPDSNFLLESPNSAFSYQGRMTIFGNPQCNSEGLCEYKDVVQYDEIDNVWRSIGQMEVQRTDMDVIEIPMEWCDDILGPSASTPGVEETTADPATTDPPLPGEENNYVAMIVGGVFEQSSGGDILPSVELFGCPGYQGEALPIEDYPHAIYLTSGFYWEEENKVIVCGGMQCDDRQGLGCRITSDCFEYNPQTGWQAFSNLERATWSHLMAEIVNIDAGGDERYPASLGYDLATEIWDPLNQAWTPYLNMPESNWRSTDCLVQYGDYIFHSRNSLQRLDTTDWTVFEWDLPEFLRLSVTCSVVRIKGVAGIMLKNGYWFNLQTEMWEALQFPPYPTFIGEPDALFSYQGLPTIFGNPSCNSEGECLYLDVVQYDDQEDVWYNLGEMLHSRRFHSVIEVPQSFCDQAEPAAPRTDTAAFIVGGMTNINLGPDGLPGGEDGSGEALTRVEIFGCPQAFDRSIILDDYPTKVYGAAGVYYPDEEHILVCGGAPCDDGDLVCDLLNECYQWTPEDGWLPAEGGNLNAFRYASKMVLAPDHNSGSSARTPLVVGGYGPLVISGDDFQNQPTNLVTEIYDPNSGWVIYDLLEYSGWNSLTCLTSYNDDVYAVVSNMLYVLHTPSWTFEELGELPDELLQPQRCSPVEIDFQTGLMLRNGYWYNFDTMQWEAKMFPPNNVFVQETDAMFYFRGRPTIFGSAQCDSEGDCLYTEVVQYNPGWDRWDSLGTISESRADFEVIEVPRSICERIQDSNIGSTTLPTTTTTPEPVTDPFISPDTNTAAMIIGGAWNAATRQETMLSVELFGCPGYEERSFPLLDIPRGLYLAGATYFPNRQDVGKVIVCGGLQCNDRVIDGGFCELSDDCYEWTLDTGDWETTPGLVNSKWSHLMGLVKNLDNTITVDGEEVVVDEYVPVVLGRNDQTEIYDPTTREWTPYRELPESTEDWITANCLTQIGDMIYHIGNKFYELDTLTWTMTRELDIPPFLQQPGMCSQVRVRDVEGILLTNGYWFNLRTEEWEQLRLPPFPEFLNFELQNIMMYSFRGKPTVFNFPSCDENADCIFDTVMQYNSDFDRWVPLGNMLHHRGFSSVVEVPQEYCEVARYDEPTTRTAAIIVGGLNDPDSGNQGENLLQSVELFGCTGSLSIPLDDFPLPIYLTGGVHFILDDETDPLGKVVVCGGYSDSRIVESCFELDPNSMTWSVANYQLSNVRWAHEMVLAPDLDSGSNQRMPLVLGGQNSETEIWDPLAEEWKPYRSLPTEQGDFWTSVECTIVYQDVMYHIKNNLYSIDLFSWEIINYGEVPSFAREPGRCEITTIDGDAGIMLKNGYWYNLATSTWEAKRFPPNPPDTVTDAADAFYRFRGSFAIFGAPNCDEDGICDYREVLWYNARQDKYDTIGYMREGRHNHEVIEVPDSFCDLVDTLPLTTEEPFMGTTQDLPPEPDIDTESVALVLGGFWNHPRGGSAVASAELFGCDDSVDPVTGEYIGKLIDDFPTPVYLSGGAYYERNGVAEGAGEAVVCGGWLCPGDTVSCQESGACYSWTPTNQWQQFDGDLSDTKYGHIMVMAQNLESSSTDVVPIVLGENLDTEVFNPDTGAWESYRPLEYSGWNSVSCLIQYGDRVYQIGGGSSTDIFELDLTSWETRNISQKTSAVRNPGTCAMATIDGVPGIMTHNSYWLNLQTFQWEQKRFPPYFDGGLTPNGMATFRGKATTFASEFCTEDGLPCDHLSVYQYDDFYDEWDYMGRLVHTRTLHEIIEVPKSFCNVQSYEPPRKDTAALIVGGLGAFTDTGRRQIYNTVELFGCAGQQESILIDEYPKALYLAAGRYFEAVDRDEEETGGTVLVCGGFACDDVVNTQGCRITEECYEWTQESGWSARPENLDEPRWAHLMASVTDLDSGANARVPLVLGLRDNTAIFDYREGVWDTYLDLEENNWQSLGCLFQYEDTVYHMRTEIYALNTLTWETRMLGAVPDILARQPGRCSMSEINGEMGILLRNGFWFNLETETWEAKRFPPYINIAAEPDALFSFRGRPTMFGSPLCDGEGTCEYKEVLQYNELTDTWDSLGTMLENRQLHEVIEVPGELCEFFGESNPTTESPVTTEPMDEDYDTVAMVIGGLWDAEDEDGNQFRILSEVELFGCPDSPDSSIILQDYPENLWLSGGTLYEDKVISCGGYSCSGSLCNQIDDCFQWTPDNQWEPFVANLNYPKYSHIMATALDIDDGDGQTRVPMVIGQNSVTEIWDPDSSSWKIYRTLEGFNWISASCFFQKDDNIYHIRTEIERLDTTTWTIELLGTVPEFLTSPGKCAYQEAGDGTPGILLRNGYWYNLEDNTWTQLRFPPYANVATEPDAVWSFRGKPTVFGSTVCEGDGTCIYTGVEQFDLTTNTWKHLGELTQTRTLQDVIEVPASFCDFASDPLKPTSSAAMIIGGFEADGSSRPPIFNETELFGCPGVEDTMPGPSFPIPIYFTGGTYYSPDGTVENGKVIVCGGYGCPAGEICGIVDVCYEYNPLTDADWVEASPLVADTWGHIMTTAPDLESTSNREMPIVLGRTEETQLRDYDTEEWNTYRSLPDGNNNWLSFGCLVRYRYKVYHIREEVFELDTLYWNVVNYGPIPEFMTNNGAGPGRCAITEIDDEIGIMLRNGFFYQLSDNTWHQKKFVPHIMERIGAPSDSLYTFRGKPTYFGAPTCDENIVCSYNEILQYQDRNKQWITLGSMATSRTGHEVIEIPSEFCGTGGTTTTTTAAPMTTTEPDPSTVSTVAMIIGGINNRVAGGTITNSVELFGCPTNGDELIEIPDFPVPLYLSAGVYYPAGNRVVVCGGNQCQNLANPRECGVARTCFEYCPESGQWRKPNELISVKWGHFMGLIEDSQQREVPIVLGYDQETEIYNPDTEQWEEYLDLDDPNWTSLYCLIQVGTSIWQIRTTINELDMTSWTLNTYDEDSLPDQLSNAGQCSFLEIDGKPGILLRNGYWYNVQDDVWEQKRFPPYSSFYIEPNAMWNFRGKPTVFGNTVCQDDGECLYNEVIQYDAATNLWDTVGMMEQARGFHTVIEVPVDFCYKSTTTSTTTTTTTSSPTTTEPPTTGTGTDTPTTGTDTPTTGTDTSTTDTDTTPTDTDTPPTDTDTPPTSPTTTTTPAGGDGGDGATGVTATALLLVASIVIVLFLN